MVCFFFCFTWNSCWQLPNQFNTKTFDLDKCKHTRKALNEQMNTIVSVAVIFEGIYMDIHGNKKQDDFFTNTNKTIPKNLYIDLINMDNINVDIHPLTTLQNPIIYYPVMHLNKIISFITPTAIYQNI